MIKFLCIIQSILIPLIFTSHIKQTYIIKGEYNIRESIDNVYFQCDSTTKIIVTGEKVVISNCVFDANGHSVDRSLIECNAKEVIIKNCVVENIKSKAEKGAYGIFVDVEKCSSHIKSCKFRNISDTREEEDPFGYMKGMCGGIFYSSSKYYLRSLPYKQVAEDIELENIYTSLPNGAVNMRSNDADGIRVFINEKKTKKELLDNQYYSFRNIKGRDIQKRLIKISGATNCSISNVIYQRNIILPEVYPAHLIAVFDASNVKVSNVDYRNGCNDIALCVSNSKNVYFENIKVQGEGESINNSTSCVFLIDNCEDIHIRKLKFYGYFSHLGQLTNSKNISIDVKGKNFYFLKPFEIRNSNEVAISGRLKRFNEGPSIIHLEKIDGLSVDSKLINKKYSHLIEYDSCSGVRIE